MRRTRCFAILILTAAALLVSSSCKIGVSAGEPVTGEKFMLDTICSISVYRMADDRGEIKPASEMEDEANSAIKEAFDLCSSLESKISRTHEDSDIGRLNKAGGEWVDISSEAAELLRTGKAYSEMSEGDFDITIGAVSELWDFHAAEGEETLPDPDEIRWLIPFVNYENIEIDGDRVRNKEPLSKIDLGGIAKGYIGDHMAEQLELAGVRSGIINLGGNVICIGGKSDEEGFTIGIETPYSDRREIIGKVNAEDKTLVTSGVYERQMEVDGRIYHHILDSHTGYPVTTDLLSVTIIADKGMSCDADALSTICLIKGYEESIKFLDAKQSDNNIEAVFVLADGTIKQTAGTMFTKSN